jgi:uncharacterized delta-60 repeat protein
VVLSGRTHLWLAVVTAAFAVSGVAQAADRPGTLDRQLGYFQSTRIEGLDVGADGRIVVAGRTDGYPLFHPWVRAYLPNGNPDPSFGGDGTVELPDDRRSIAGAVVQPDGRIVVAHSAGGFYEAGTHTIRRLHADGTPDASFGNGGAIQPDAVTRLSDIVLQPDGGLIVVGARDSSTSSGVIVVARHLANGSPDPAFGSNGITELPVDTPYPRPAVAVQGAELVVTHGLEIARLSPEGRLDNSFGAGGFAPVELAERWRRRIGGVGAAAILPDRRIRIPVWVDMPRQPASGMSVVGLTKDGHVDGGFGVLGLARAPRLTPPEGESAETAIADRRGGIIVAGTLFDARDLVVGISAVLRRFRPDGRLDRSFGDRGVVRGVLPASSYPTFEQRLAMVDGDTLVVAEHTYDAKYSSPGPGVARMLHAGYDREKPAVSVTVQGCRAALVKITDDSPIEAVARVGGRVVRRTTRKRFRVRSRRGGRRLSVRVTDLADNSARRGARLPHC